MLLNIQPKKIDEVYETPVLQQTAFWSEVKRLTGVDSMAFDFKVDANHFYEDEKCDSTLVSDVLIMSQKIDEQHSIAYVPYGPEVHPADSNQGAFLEELSESLRSFLPDTTIMIRYDLFWDSLWVGEEGYYDEDGYWLGPPEKRIQELRLNYNTENWLLRKSACNSLPSNTVFLDLEKSKEELLMAMKPKTRYNIRLSKRRGVVVRKTGWNDLDVWYALYRETALRNGIFLHDKSYFRAVLKAKATCPHSPAKVHLLIAEADNTPLAAIFLVISGRRATYLYGASSSSGRHLMGSYAVQWRAITLAKEEGCTEYDMFGIAPRPDPNHPMCGLHRFKTGFGGTIHHSLGSWDYLFQEEKYNYLAAQEIVQPGYHIT